MAPSCSLESALPSLPGPLHPPLKIPCGNGTLASARRRVRIPSSHSGRDEYWRTPMCEEPPVLRVARSHCSDDQSSATSFTNTGLDRCESVAPPGAMARVLAVDPNAGRCLLTDTDSDIQLVYCIPRDLHPSKLDNLESAWNLEHGSLNTDSRYNIFPITRELGRLFNAGDWILVPTAQTVETYFADEMIPVGTDFPQIPDQIFEYTLLTRSSLNELTFQRQSRQDPEKRTTHSYPFVELGTLRSHLHPRFVIWNLGRKLDKDITFFQTTLRHQEAAHAMDFHVRSEWVTRLLDACQVYDKWMDQSRTVLSPRGDVGIAPSISSSQQTRRARAIHPSMSASHDSSEPQLTKRNLKALYDRFGNGFVTRDVVIRRWRTFCELASCGADECDIDPDELGDDEDNGSEYDVEIDAADLEMGSSDTAMASADVEMAVIGDGVGDDGPQPETFFASDTCPTRALRACSMPPFYADAPSPPPSRHDASSPPPRDASSPLLRGISSSPSRNTSMSSSSVPGPATSPPASYYTLARGSSKSCKRSFADIACEDDVEDQLELGVPSKRTRIGF